MMKVRHVVAAFALLSTPAASAVADEEGGGSGSGPPICGDGLISDGEVCDDGAWNGMPGNCDAMCTGTAPDQCGDWMTTGGEVCDSGPYNGQPYNCNADCTGMTTWCGDGAIDGAETCDDGWQNGQEGYCNDTCTGIDPRTPFLDAERAPTLQGLSYGRVLASRAYEVTFGLGDVPGVGLAPGFGLSLRVLTGSAAGRCGAACDVPLATLAADGGDLVLDEGAGPPRRFVADGASWRELPPEPGVAFRPATIAVASGEHVVTEVGGTLQRAFDGSGREVRRATPWGAVVLAYDGDGRLTSATNAAGAALAVAYDGAGRIASVTDPTGFTMTLRYAADGHLVALEGPADGAVTPSIAFTWWGDDLTAVGRLGFNPIELSYDRGLVSFARDVDGTAFAFDSSAGDNQVIDSSMQYRRLVYDGGKLAAIETSAGSLTTFVRDGLGRVIETRVATGGDDLVTRVTYDAQHRVTSTTDAEGRTATVTYDAAGNVIAATDADGRTSTFTYDGAGRLLTATDPLGRTSSTTYDANGLPLAQTAGGLTTSQTYDARGLVATATDAYGVTTTYSYDGAGRLAAVSRPGEPTVTIARAPSGDGEAVTITRNGQSSTTVSDRYGRVTSSSSSLGGATAISYDPVTGLPASTSATFRGHTQTTQTTYTNTGDAAQVWVNGQQRQAAARLVPPGNAGFMP